MDPMDYTMDDGQTSQQHTATHQFPCQNQQSYPSRTNDFLAARASRENQHYDPVHDSSGWYQPNNTNAQSRPPYTAQQGLTQWGAPTYGPIPSWQGFSDVQSGSQLPDATMSYRPPSFTGMGLGNSPWAEGRGYDGAPYGYSAYNSALNSNTGHSEQTAGPQHSPHAPPPNPHAIAQRRAWQQARAEHDELVRHRASTFSASPFAAPDFARARPDGMDVGTSRGTQPHISPADHRSGGLQSGNSQRNRIEINNDDLAHARATRLRLANGLGPDYLRRRGHGHWSSDDDDDAVPEMNSEESYRRSTELLFSPEDEERNLAAVRGAMAAGKRIPSKEAIASLVPMSIDAVKAEGSDINCMICYNDYGTVNPEGTIESPLQLSKCKHIFGNVCIKKWFEDSDTCPYCRDKLPSELSIKKTHAFEAYRVVRERERQLLSTVHRQRYAQVSRHFPDGLERNSDSSSPPSREEYEQMLSRGNDWGFTSPRQSPGDSPERRRQRGRAVNSRSAQHIFGRPISVGSGRVIPPGHPSQRAVVLGLSPGNAHHPMSAGTQRRPIAPSIASGLPSGSNAAPQRNRPSSGMSASSTEEASPAVAIGSFVPAPPQNRRETETTSAQTAYFEQTENSRASSTPANTVHPLRVYSQPSEDRNGPGFDDSADSNSSSSLEFVQAPVAPQGGISSFEYPDRHRPRWSR